MKRLTLIFAVLCLLIGAALVVPASAQCVPRTDWNPYTVMRGDTIYGIARRFGTSPSNLIQGNCLANPNYLLAGQILRVPSASYSTGATFQSFQNGFMVWREDTGEIRVFIGTTSGELTVYPLSTYGPLPGRTIMPPESGRQFFIAFGFAKVWSNMPGVKEQLGYATGGEQGYTMLINTLPSFTIPGNYEVYNVSGSTWAVAVSPGTSPMPYGEVSPTPTAPPGVIGPQVSLFAVSPAAVMPGDTLTISWEVYNAGNIAIKAAYRADYRLFLDYTSEVFPASSGSTTITIPTHTDVYNTEAAIQLYWARDAAPENWQLLDSVTRTLRIGCPVTLAWGAPGGCGQEPVKLISALYQPFERGFMLFLMDIDGAYDGVYTVILDDEHQTGYTFESQPVTLGTPPEGLFAPDAVFVETWTRSPQYEQAIGWATGPAQSYTASAQTEHFYIRDPSTIRENYVTLPDGRVILFSGSVLGGVAIRWDWVE